MPLRRLLIPLALALSLVFAGSAQAFVYWGDYQGGTIGRANLDGTNVEDGFIQVGGRPDGVAVNSTYIYWTNESAGTIGRAKLDGTAVEPNFITGIKTPRGLAVSPTAIFWASIGSQAIGRANLDGTMQNFALVPNAGTTVCSIAIDSGHIYWGNSGLDSYIGRASLTGSGANAEWVSLGTYTPCAVATNTVNVFFGDTGFFASGHEIGRVSASGAGLDKSIIGEAEGPCGMTVFEGKLYWANTGNDTIGVANTDATGQNEGLVHTGGNQICGVAVDALSSPVIPPTTPPGGGDSGGSSSPPPPSPPTPGTVKLLKLTPDPLHGTAEVKVTVNEAGVVSLTGKGIVAAKATASGASTVKLPVRAKKAGRVTLKRTTKLATKLTVGFRPSDGGADASFVKTTTLRKQLAPKVN